MKKLMLLGAVGTGMLMSASVANAQTIAINGSSLPGTPVTQNVTSGDPNTAINQVNSNDADITASITGVTVTTSTGDIDQADAEINDNSALASVFGNSVVNEIDLGDSGQAPSNLALIGNSSTVTDGAALSTEISGVEFSIDADGNFVGDSDLEINGTQVSATTDANSAENSIVGNFDDLSAVDPANAPADFYLEIGAEGTVDAQGNFVIGNFQFTQGNVTVESTIDDLELSISGDGTGAAGGTFPDSAEITDTVVATRSRGNAAFNTINGQNDGDPNGFGIASLQLNSADVTATVSNVSITLGLNGGALDRMNADLSNNTIGAAAAGNVVVNRISFAD